MPWLVRSSGDQELRHRRRSAAIAHRSAVLTLVIVSQSSPSATVRTVNRTDRADCWVMAVDKEWVAVERVVRAALYDDRQVLKHPPESDEDWMGLAETITDHIVAAFKTTPRNSG
jgi:hypothetical protein